MLGVVVLCLLPISSSRIKEAFISILLAQTSCSLVLCPGCRGLARGTSRSLAEVGADRGRLTWSEAGGFKRAVSLNAKTCAKHSDWKFAREKRPKVGEPCASSRAWATCRTVHDRELIGCGGAFYFSLELALFLCRSYIFVRQILQPQIAGRPCQCLHVYILVPGATGRS